MIKSGTTAFVDAGSYHMEAAAEVYVRSGLRGLLSASTMDEKGLPASIAQNADEAVAPTDRLYDRYHGKGNLKGGILYALSYLLFRGADRGKTAERAKERGAKLQAHMNEYAGEVNFSLTNRRMRPFEYLDSLGVLNGDFLAAHCLLLSEREKEILAERDAESVSLSFQQLRERSAGYALSSGERDLRRPGNGRGSSWRIKSVE